MPPEVFSPEWHRQMHGDLNARARSQTPESITARRKALGMTQSELAKRLGKARTTIVRWECGKSRIPHWLYLVLLGLELKKKAADAGLDWPD